MTIAQLVFYYLTIIFILILALAAVMIRSKAAGKPILPQIAWREILNLAKGVQITGDFWLKTFLAAFIALCAGLIIAIFIWPRLPIP